jgi:carboxyl-terminal processing protease
LVCSLSPSGPRNLSATAKANLDPGLKREDPALGTASKTTAQPTPAPVKEAKTFSVPSTLATEASTLVKLLEQAHYNHETVLSSAFEEVIPDFMSDLDGQRLLLPRLRQGALHGRLRRQGLL